MQASHQLVGMPCFVMPCRHALHLLRLLPSASNPQVIDHPGFGSLFMLLIIANTVLLAMTTAGGQGAAAVICGLWVCKQVPGRRQPADGCPKPPPGGAGMSDARRAALDEVSSAFTWIFLAETLLKLLGLGAAGFFSDGMNAFDSAVVALSLVDTFASVSRRLPSCLPPARRDERRLCSCPGRGLASADLHVPGGSGAQAAGAGHLGLCQRPLQCV